MRESKTYRTSLSTKGQVVIPAEIREQLHLEPGTAMTLDVRDGEVRLAPLNEDTIDRFQGMFSDHKRLLRTFRTERKREDAARMKKLERRLGL